MLKRKESIAYHMLATPISERLRNVVRCEVGIGRSANDSRAPTPAALITSSDGVQTRPGREDDLEAVAVWVGLARAATLCGIDPNAVHEGRALRGGLQHRPRESAQGRAA